MKCDTVIIFSIEDDVHAQAVQSELAQRENVNAHILDTAGYPGQWCVSLYAANQHKETDVTSWRISGTFGTIESQNVAGCWWRRARKHALPPCATHVKQFCLDESRAAFEGWLHLLGSRLINPLGNERRALKPVQLAVAKECGLHVPQTLFTNDAAEAKQFFNLLDGKVIFKTFTGTSWQMTETRRLLPEHLEKLETLDSAPVIFQQLVESKVDIRATVVDNQVFSIAISPEHPGAALDWRLDQAPGIEPHPLPDQVKDNLLAMMRSLGLRYGACDLVVDSDGQYIFLEVNPGGQFLFAEIHGGQPISRALADALLSPPATEQRLNPVVSGPRPCRGSHPPE